MSDERCHCGGAFAPAGHGIVPLLKCRDCGREVPGSALALGPPRPCAVCGGSGVRCCEFGADRAPNPSAADGGAMTTNHERK